MEAARRASDHPPIGPPRLRTVHAHVRESNSAWGTSGIGRFIRSPRGKRPAIRRKSVGNLPVLPQVEFALFTNPKSERLPIMQEFIALVEPAMSTHLGPKTRPRAEAGPGFSDKHAKARPTAEGTLPLPPERSSCRAP